MKYCSFIPLPKFFSAAFCFAVLSVFSVKAQTSATSSPYSRFALGRPENTGFSEITALGGSYTAMRNDTSNTNTFFINQGNPASYAYNKFTIYEFGARYGYYTFTTQDGSVKKQNGGFNYISLSFPIRKKMGAAIGHVPFSNVGYEATTTTETVDSIGSIKNNYRGTGGVNQVYGGLAWRPFESRLKNLTRSAEYRLSDSVVKNTADMGLKNSTLATIRRKRFFANTLSTLSVGSNVSFLYGTINYATRKYFPPTFGAVYNTCDYTETQLHDVYVQGGMQISFEANSVRRKFTAAQKALPDSAKQALNPYRDLKKRWRFTLGYSVSLPKNVSATATHAAYNFTLLSFNREVPFDTFSYQPNYRGTVKLPLMQSVGLAVKHGESLTMTFDAGLQQWSKFEFLGQSQGLKDQWRVAGGLQWQPDRMAIGTAAYFKRTFYRLGARYNTGYLSLRGNQINEYAVSGGLGLPVGRYKVFTVINLTAEYGISGTTNNQLVQEKFLRFVIGLTFNDRWFIKPKYD